MRGQNLYGRLEKFMIFKCPKRFRPRMLSFYVWLVSLQKCKFVVLNKQRIQYLVNMIRGLGLFFDAEYGIVNITSSGNVTDTVSGNTDEIPTALFLRNKMSWL